MSEQISADVKQLASDDFQGRGLGGVGQERTVNYIVRRFASVGLEPGGAVEANGQRGWLQRVDIRKFALRQPSAVTVESGSSRVTLAQGRDIAVSTRASVSAIELAQAPLVFVGFGISDKGRGWDDFKGVDLHGKVAVVLINDPDNEIDLGGLFKGPTMTYPGRWTYKFEEMERRGALGVLIVHEDRASTISWDQAREYFSGPRYTASGKDQASVKTLIEGWIPSPVALALFRANGLDLNALKKAAASRAFKPITLNSTLSFSSGVEQTPLTSYNVVGQVAGSERPDETVIYTAHWDHMGIGSADKSGDRIYNGAQDNAAGVAGLIALGNRFAHASAPKRTVVFMAVTGEEVGLLGSVAYVQQPLFSLPKTVADLNLDALDIKGPTHDVSLWGRGDVSLEADLARVAKVHGRVLATNPRFEVGYYYRSDHLSFARAGVPAITLGSGVDMVRGGAPAGRAAEDDYFANRYHHPSDEWKPSMDFSGIVADLEVYYSLGRELADGRTRPSFETGSDFRSAQEALRSGGQ